MLNFFRRFFAKNEEEIVSSEMKYLVIGLGNMHPDYDGTRHNIGFEVVENLAERKEVSFKNDTLGDLALIKHKGRHIYLLKPSTYMNRSGKAVNYWMSKHKIKVENILVIVDDLNLEFGKLRLRGKGADGGHNGLKDIQQVLGTGKYARLRLGIGSEYFKGQQVNFVLGKWSNQEKEGLPKLLEQAGEAVLSYCSIGLNFTMNQVNKK